MNIEISLIEQSSPRNNELLEAARYMCFQSYNRFKKNWHRGNNNYTLQKGLEVHYLENDTSKPIIFEQYEDSSFSPCICNDKKAFEEQCVHEIVVYRQKFMKNLFANWHMRRECVTCSPSPLTTNSNKISKEIPVATDWLKSERKGPNPFGECNNMLLHSNGCNTSGFLKGGSHHVTEYQDYGMNDTTESYTPCSQLKVTSSTMHKLSGEFNGNWNKASEETQTKVFAIYLELNSLLMFDGQNPSMKLSPERTATVDKMFSDIVVNYQKSFLGKSGNFQPVKLLLKSPHRNILQKQPKARLKPTQEIVSKRFKQVKKSVTTCTFCKEPGHQRTNCSRRIALQNEGTEYTMNNDVGMKIHFRSLINELESHSNIEPMHYGWEVLDQLDSRQGFRRMLIENAYSAIKQVGSVAVSLNSMYFRITFLDKNAHALNERIPTIISGSVLKFYLQKACEKVTPIYIYNKCALKRTTAVQENVDKAMIDPYKREQYGNTQLSTSNQETLKSPGMVSPYSDALKSPGIVSPYIDALKSPGIVSPCKGVNPQIGMYATYLEKKRGCISGHCLEEEFNSNSGHGESEI
jgi:hypothetical protein